MRFGVWGLGFRVVWAKSGKTLCGPKVVWAKSRRAKSGLAKSGLGQNVDGPKVDGPKVVIVPGTDCLREPTSCFFPCSIVTDTTAPDLTHSAEARCLEQKMA